MRTVRALAPSLARIALAALAPLCFACSPPAEKPPAGAGSAAEAEDVDLVAGKIGGEEVTVGDIDTWIMGKLFDNATGGRNPSRLFEIRKRALEQMAGEQALDAAARTAGKERDALLQEEIERRAAVGDDEVQAFYEEHKQRYGDRSFEQLSASIRRQLEQQKRQKAAEEYVGSLRASAGFESRLEPPRFEILGDGPALGPADAPITLVEFSDYQCPFCKSAERVVKAVKERYPTQIKLVFRHFPLDNIHPQARGAAEAAACAEEQGKFWSYHEILFHRAPKLEPELLKDYATSAGLDRAAFDACLDEKKQAAKVQADLEAGQKAGVAGTPAFYVNGLPVAGARNLAQFAEVIDAELTRLGLPTPAPVEPEPPMMPGPGPRTFAPPSPPGVPPAPPAPSAADAPPAAAPAAPEAAEKPEP